MFLVFILYHKLPVMSSKIPNNDKIFLLHFYCNPKRKETLLHIVLTSLEFWCIIIKIEINLKGRNGNEKKAHGVYME